MYTGEEDCESGFREKSVKKKSVGKASKAIDRKGAVVETSSKVKDVVKRVSSRRKSSSGEK